MARTKTRKVNVSALDFDGSVFNLAYCSSSSENRLYNSNKFFFSNVTEYIYTQHFHKIVFMCGSNRQCRAVDIYNAQRNKTSSCYNALARIHKVFQTKLKDVDCLLDGYLLVDTFNSHQNGEHFNQALQVHPRIYSDPKQHTAENGFHFAKTVFDTSKLLLVYAQVHKIASEHLDADITYDLYDDTEPILNNLYDFFKSNPDLIPKNVRIKLNHYAGGNVSRCNGIQGTGDIDHNYQINIQQIVDVCDHHYYGQSRRCSLDDTYDFVSIFSDPYILKAFYLRRILHLPRPLLELNPVIKSEPVKDLAELPLPRIELATDLISKRNYMAEMEKEIEHFKHNKNLYAALCALKLELTHHKSIHALVAKETLDLLTAVKLKPKNIDCVKHYEKNCKKLSRSSSIILGKVIFNVIVATLSFLLALGASVLTGGTTTIALAVSAGVGLTAGGISGFLLFKPNALEKKVEKVIKHAGPIARKG
jgi:hypothetical protein